MTSRAKLCLLCEFDQYYCIRCGGDVVDHKCPCCDEEWWHVVAVKGVEHRMLITARPWAIKHTRRHPKKSWWQHIKDSFK